MLVKSLLAIAFGIPFAAAGLLLTLSVIGAIVGVPLLALGAWPLYKVQKNHGDRIVQWETRARVMDNEEEKPWMM